MMAQYLSAPAAQQAVMNSLFAAFAGFTAFGAAIVGPGLPKLRPAAK